MAPNFDMPLNSDKDNAEVKVDKVQTGQLSEEAKESQGIAEEDEENHTHEMSAHPRLGEEAEFSPLPLIIERRFCTVCKLDQPIRAKHCKECKSCVALHDHHCPWLGVCIGERNRRAFYWYLIAQNIELWWAVARTCKLFAHRHGVSVWLQENLMRLFLVVVLLFFIVMLTCLLIFHTYLACSNRTTCKAHVGEHVSWEKISYLKDWPAKYGSPFSRGCLPNLYIYCLAKVPLPYRTWEMPSALPEIAPKDFLLC